jgi:carbamoyl-phosphate synthase small subunit
VVPASTGAEEILAMQPDGIFLSNGPGDPEATGAMPCRSSSDLFKTDIPVFGICLGHQMLALALGGKTAKMHQGHHGANHPVKDHTTGKVEIVSMNHGFAVDADSLPEGVEETHVSLFDGSNCGITLTGRPVFSVQHHPRSLARPAGLALSLPPLRQFDPRKDIVPHRTGRFQWPSRTPISGDLLRLEDITRLGTFVAAP